MKQRVKKVVSRYWLNILSGILIGTSFIPFPAWGSLIAFVPLWIQWWNANRVREIVIGGWITQFTLTLIGFNWVAHTAHEFGHLPMSLSLVVLLLFCSTANLYIPIVGSLWGWLHRARILPRAVLTALLPVGTMLGEFLVPTLFPWNFGYTWLWSEWPLAHLGEWIGFRAISYLVIAFNMTGFLIWRFRDNRTICGFILACAVGLFSGFSLLGHNIQEDFAAKEPNKSLRVLIVQANIGNQEKIFAEKQGLYREHIVTKYLRITEKALEESPKEVDFIVWPETAFPLDPRDSRTLLVRQLRFFLNKHNVGLITGAYGHTSEGTTNSIFFIAPDRGQKPLLYSKTNLLAFGEYLPLAETFPILKQWIPNVGDFRAGKAPKVLQFSGVHLGAQVCYESLFPSLTRTLVEKQAQAIVNVTNDSWYGTWQEPYQHLYMTAARAIEFRRPLIRSTNTGISTVVTANGEILETSPLEEEWAHLYSVPYLSEGKSTLYKQHQTWWDWSPGIILILLLIASGIPPRKIGFREYNEHR